MNISKNMEAVFIVTLALACSATTMLSAHAQAPAVNASIATPSTVAVVTVSAKRMTAAEKLQSLQEERKLTGLRSAAGSRI